MSLYGFAINQGVNAAITMLGTSAAEGVAYNKGYSAQVRRTNALARQNVAEQTITTIKQNNLIANEGIKMKQKIAKSHAVLAAAVAGVEGGSVDATINQTATTAALAIQSAKKQAAQGIEQQKAQVYGARSTLLAVQEPKSPSIGQAMLGAGVEAISSITADDMKSVKEAWYSNDSVTKTTPTQATRPQTYQQY